MLLVGPTTSGKTLFSKQIQEHLNGNSISEQNVPSTIPTVGTNMTTLHISRKDSVEMRELGGSMAPIWKKYYKNCNAIIFLADKSNAQQLSADYVLLLEMLTHTELKSVPFLILWNKIDSPSCMTDGYITNVIDLPAIKQHTSQDITWLDCSAVTGEGFKDIKSWIQSHSVS